MKKLLILLLTLAFMPALAPLADGSPPPKERFITAYGLDSLALTGDVMVFSDRSIPSLYGNDSFVGLTRDDDASRHYATFDFDVPADGKYALWFYVYATSDTDNSFYVAVDRKHRFTFDFVEGDRDYFNIWYWVFLNSREDRGGSDALPNLSFRHAKVLDLTAGAHSLRIAVREPGARLSRIILTDDLNYDPNKDTSIASADPIKVYPVGGINPYSDGTANCVVDGPPGLVVYTPKIGDGSTIFWALAGVSAVGMLALLIFMRRRK